MAFQAKQIDGKITEPKSIVSGSQDTDNTVFTSRTKTGRFATFLLGLSDTNFSLVVSATLGLFIYRLVLKKRSTGRSYWWVLHDVFQEPPRDRSYGDKFMAWQQALSKPYGLSADRRERVARIQRSNSTAGAQLSPEEIERLENQLTPRTKRHPLSE